MFVRINDRKTEKQIRAVAKEKSTSMTGAVAWLISKIEPKPRGSRHAGAVSGTKRATKRQRANKAATA